MGHPGSIGAMRKGNGKSRSRSLRDDSQKGNGKSKDKGNGKYKGNGL
jgi:hypothetical protein